MEGGTEKVKIKSPVKHIAGQKGLVEERFKNPKYERYNASKNKH